ncbi:MAG: YihY/virulence factor BrkB family protein [Schumannella sp.]
MVDAGDQTSGGLAARGRALLVRVRQHKPVRVIAHYAARRGPILAAGLSYQAIFSVFAGLWAAFSLAGLLIAGTPGLRDALFDVLSTSVPGLIDRGEGGATTPEQLLSASALGWTGAIAVVVAVFTSVSWFSSARDAVRDIAELAAPPVNVVLLRLRDLGLALAFGVALIASAALSLGSTTALAWVLDGVGIGHDSVLATVLGRGLGLALAFGLDLVVLVALYRVLAGVPIPARPLWQGALLGALALGVLKTLGSVLLGGASSNPVVASFAVIAGLLIWFNLVCQVILIAAAWVVVSATDAGVPLDPIGERDRRQAELRMRLEIEEQVRAELEADLPRAVRWIARRRRDKALRAGR